jgi:tetratricopeptide (TPR) repeat protein
MSFHRLQSHAVVYVSCLAMSLSGGALFGQANAVPNIGRLDQRHVEGQFAISFDVQAKPTQPQQPHAESDMVTVQELKHAVPRKARSEMEKAENARLKQREEEMAGHLKQAVSIDPEFVAARNNLAVFYLKTGNPESALAQLEEAARIDPHNARVFNNLALGYTMTRNFDAAERAARSAIGFQRVGANARMILGMVLLQQSKFTEEALRCFELARGEYPVADLLAARVFIARGNPEKGKSYIETYLARGDNKNTQLADRLLSAIAAEEQKSAVVSSH